jgi:two-component system nitrate/nitrite sensor histidine kinase NarX
MSAANSKRSLERLFNRWLRRLPNGHRISESEAAQTDLLGPLTGLALAFVAIAACGLLMLRVPEWGNRLYFLMVLLLLGCGALVGLILQRVQQQLVEPLEHLHHWAHRMHSGNLAARLPVPESGRFAKLARDINGLSEELMILSHDMESRVAQQTQSLARKTRSLQVLYDVAASISVSRNLDELLTCFLHTLAELVHASAAVVRLQEGDGHMRVVDSLGFEPLPAGEQDWDALMAARQGDEERVEVPLSYQGRTLGDYILFVPQSDAQFQEERMELLTSIGQHLGMAIDTARLDEEAKRLSIIEERTRLASELHDSLAQTLASLRFQVNLLGDKLRTRLDGDPPRELLHIRNSVEEAYIELRELIGHFRAPMDDKGLLPALMEVIDRFRRQTDITIFFQKECQSPQLPAAVELQVVRIVQEALANIRKHAQARAVRVMLRCSDDGVYRVLVEDDGVGMEEPVMHGPAGEHIGLDIMKERARRIGGELRIESEPGEGTRMQLDFDLRQDPQRQLALT